MVTLIILVAILGILLSGLRILYQYEIGVVFTLGKFTGIKKAGLVWVIPLGIQDMKKVDMRIRTIEVPRQEIITKDNISVTANAVIYFRIVNAEDAIIKIQNLNYAITQFTQSALRDVVGNHEMDFVLSERIKIGYSIKEVVYQETTDWGIVVDSIKIQEIEIPQELKRAMAKQAEAERERRAMIINSDGELEASKKLTEAAEMLSKYPAAMQLRTLQTIRDISANPSQKIVLFMPSDINNFIKDVVNK